MNYTYLIVILIIIIVIGIIIYYCYTSDSKVLIFTNETDLDAPLEIRYCKNNQVYFQQDVPANQSVRVNHPGCLIDIIFTHPIDFDIL